jgi:serine/threonine-protein kinase
MTTLIGQEFGGYRIISQVGKGGMATVYKAFQASLDRYVAVKVMPPFYAQEDDTFLKRFRREARAVAKLRHPNILMVIDYGERDGLTYIVMEYVDAGTLTDRLGSPLPLNDIASIIDQVAGALDHGHGQGVVHRDVKPSNILLPKPNWPLLTDFGLAKIVGGSQLTITGSIAGTPAYMSPEQGQGEVVDSRSDIYSLGIVLYEMATGRVPYHAETPMAVVVKHIIESLPLPRTINTDLPEEVERVILKALAKNPEDRYQRVVDLSNALMEACEQVGAPTILKETVIEDVPPKPPVPVEQDVSSVPTEPVPEEPPVIHPSPSPPPPEPVPEETPVIPPPLSPPLPDSDPPVRVKKSGMFEGRNWLKWAVPAGLIVAFLCMIGFTALIIPPLLNGTDPTSTPFVDPTTAAEHIQQGYQFYDGGNYQSAIEEFEAAIGLGSDDVDMYFDLSDAYYETNRTDEAIATLERVVAIAPNDSYILETAGWFYQYFEFHEAAIHHFERALEIDPSAEYLFLDIADSFEALGEYDKAEEYRRLSGSAQKPEDAAELEAQGWEQYYDEDYQASLDSFSQAVDLDPSLLTAWSGLSDSYWYLGDSNTAIFTLETALEANQPEGWVYEKIGWLYWDLGDYDNAKHYYEQSIAFDPEWSSGYISLADIYYELGDYEMALASYQMGLEANANRSDILERIGYAYIDVGDIERGIESFEQAIELDPFYGWNHYGLAYAYFYAGRYDEAGASLENASENGFEDAWLEDSIGWMYIDLDRCDLAIAHFQIALELDPSMSDAQEGIAACGG